MPELTSDNTLPETAATSQETTQVQPINPIPDFEAAKVVLDEWKWRHQHCWKSLQRFGITAIAIAAVPYARAEILQKSLGKGTLIFPLAAWILTLAAAWLFTTEYTRCRPAETKYYELLGKKYRPLNIYGQAGSQRLSIGRSTIGFFVIGSTLASVANAWILIKVANLQIPSTLLWCIVLLPLVLSLFFASKMTSWARDEINRLTNRADGDKK